jgi:hypothetical protein
MDHPLKIGDRLLDLLPRIFVPADGGKVRVLENRVVEITRVIPSPPGPLDPPNQSHYYECITVSQPDNPKRVGSRGGFDNITADRRYTKVSKINGSE